MTTTDSRDRKPRRAVSSLGRWKRLRLLRRQRNGASETADATFADLSLTAQLYVAGVIVAGGVLLALFLPTSFPQPILFLVLLAAACLTSAWKVNLPIPVGNGATLSVSYTACLMSLLLLGPRHAVLIAAAGVITQCTYKVRQPYPLHRTLFSAATAVITMASTSAVFHWMGGPSVPFELLGSAKPLVGAIATYFLVNTTLVAGAIALSTSRTFLSTWLQDFLWVGASFMVAGSVGALGAIVVARGQQWRAILLVAPIYLTYRTYELFVGRLEDQKRHTEEIQRLHQETVAALGQAREAERALAGEKERLALALADMTRLEELRNQLLEREQAARASAEDANRLKDQFLAVVSHELRTPLNAILGWADMLRQGKIADSMRDRAARTIFSSAKRQAQLIEDLLDVARIASGKMRLERSAVDARAVVRDALQVVHPSADAKGIDIVVDADPRIGPIHGDGARVQQIIWNLLANAVKFTPEGGAIHVRLRRWRNTAEIAITDTGQGISADFLPSLFEPFRQADASTTRVHEGLGLGLSIVKSLVDAHGGTVTAESAGIGKGATFTVRLPLAVYEQPLDISDERDDAASPVLESTGALQGISVLVVDDEDDSRDVVAAHLQQHHADVLTAASAADAFDILQQRHVDVLLADIGMPGEDGYSLIRRVRAIEASEVSAIPAAALTAFARDEDRMRALQAGFQLHLAKPIDARSLVSAVVRLRKRTEGV